MKKKSLVIRVSLQTFVSKICFALLFGMMLGPVSQAQTAGLPRGVELISPEGEILLKVGQGEMLNLKQPAAHILVADPEIVGVQPLGKALPQGMQDTVQVVSPAVSADPDAMTMNVDSPVVSRKKWPIYGEKVGVTTLYALDDNEQVITAFRIKVEYDLEGLKEKILGWNPGIDKESFRIEPSVNDSLLVRGNVRTPLQAKQLIESVQTYLDSVSGPRGGGAGSGGRNSRSVINQLKVEQSAQVNIQVRVVEMSRTMSHELGFDWAAVLSTSRGVAGAATGGFGNLFSAASNTAGMVSGMNGVIGSAVPAGGGISAGGFRTRGNFGLGVLLTAMQGEGMATVLAEPNLTAMSGETAAFAAGGEVPIVIITNNNVQIDYKSYGVILRMTPTLLSSNRISLHIAPEVSELTAEGSVTLEGGSTIPAFTVRRADTTVELASGQSFALAGMLRSNTGQTVQGVPGLRSLPLLGRFFEHEQTERRETELVILVTAYVVDPVSKSDLKVPGQGIPDIDSLVPQQAAAGYLY
ncbi:MAG: type II and III secretion system protein family protein [Corticimicrobacter sp.]|uniref:type II and III secretion system protein family protein n=1 Tax=Corticimicrobacter sp. TaxID=2678536 RepID=UPI0032D9E1DC